MKASYFPKNTCLLSISLLLLSLLLIGTSNAQTAAKPMQSNQEGRQAERPRHEPPAQAFEKCKAKKEGDTVQIITPRGDKITGHCTVSAKGLFARPERPPQPPEGDGEASKERGQRKR